MVERVRSRPWGIAVAAIIGDETEIEVDAGADPLEPASLFQIGSVTKTMTGVLLADAIGRGEVEPDTTIGSLLDVDGPAAAITVQSLATQRSGLPRLPPNLRDDSMDPADPYASYTLADLLEGLHEVVLHEPVYEYSNFGFMTLGAALAAATGRSMADLLGERLFGPLGMTSAGCPPDETGRLPGYSGPAPTPWWSTQLPGAGGVGASVLDLAAYLRAHVTPDDGPLGAAIVRASTIHAEGGGTPMGYGWVHQGGGWWHNGGTGGFRSFAAFHRPSRTAVALLANSAQAEMLDGVGFPMLTEMVGRR